MIIVSGIIIVASGLHAATTSKVSVTGSSIEVGATVTSVQFKSAGGQVYTAIVTTSGDFGSIQLPPTTYTTTIEYTVSETSITQSYSEACPGNSVDLTNDGGLSEFEFVSCESYPTVVVSGTYFSVALGSTPQSISFGSDVAVSSPSSGLNNFIVAVANNATYPVEISYQSSGVPGNCSAGVLNLQSFGVAVDYEAYDC